jgi:phosphoribosyl-dephospho-CoA transferase
MFARIHDLLEIDVGRFLQAQVSVPAGWVAGSLQAAPFVVVRRGLISAEQGISVGVRGTRRSERWAGVCQPNIVRTIVTPQALLRRVVPAGQIAAASQRAPASALAPSTSGLTPSAGDLAPLARSVTVPALRSLPLLAERWGELKFSWGPGGSVGFELATGCPVASLESDLDVVIYAQTPLGTAEARALLDCAQGLPAAVDIRVETPICGFSLTEYANRGPAPILLRFASGTALGSDPWAELGQLANQSGAAGSSRTE